MTITSSTFTECSAADSGGGVYLDEYNYYMTITNSTFTDCSAHIDGGG